MFDTANGIKDLVEQDRRAQDNQRIGRFIEETRGIGLTAAVRAGLVRSIFGYAMTPQAVYMRDHRADKG